MDQDVFALVLVTRQADRTFMGVLAVGTEQEVNTIAYTIDEDIDPDYALLVQAVVPPVDWMLAPTVDGVTLDGRPVRRI